MQSPLYGAVISFENTAIPSGWNVQKGSLSVSSDKAKLGTKALCWNWTQGDVLNAVNPEGLSTASTQVKGGISIWVYSTVVGNNSVSFSFYDSNDQKKCSIAFNLNFVGWRCLWAEFGRDMGHDNKTTLATMKILAPSIGGGTLFFDFLEFKDISWEKMSNFQYIVNQYEGISNYLNIRNTEVDKPIIPTEEQRNAFNVIADRMDKWYLGNGKNTSDVTYIKRLNAVNNFIKTGVTNFSKEITLTSGINNTVNGPGLFPMDYNGATVDGVNLTSFRSANERYLIQLAYDYRKNGSIASRDNLLKAYNWYYDQGWADGSALGTLRFEMLRSAGFFHSAFLMRNQLNDDQFKKIFDSFNWYALFGNAYSNTQRDGELADYIRTMAYPKLCYALTIKDEAQRTAAMKAFQGYLNNALRVAPGFSGTMKADGSGYHHHAPYYSAYYPDVLYASSLICYLLHDTPFALSQEAVQNLKKALLTFRFFSGEYNVPTSTCGRFPQQTNVLQQLLPAFAYIILSDNQPDKELLAAYKRLWVPAHSLVDAYVAKAKTDICFSSTLGEADALIEASQLNDAVAESNPIGTKYFPFSGLLVARQNNWMVSVKGFSQYIWDFEGSTTENLYGRYLSYDHVEYSDLVNHYRSLDINVNSDPNWDWRQIPGTTTKALSTTNLNFNKVGKHRNFSTSTFLGGIGFDDRCAIFTNQLHDNTFDTGFYADKSVFVFGNVFYCMGSGIKSRSTTVPFNTTLFQNRLSVNATPFYMNGTEITTDVNKVSNATIKDNFGNTYIVNDGLTSIKKGANYCMAYIEHGNIIDNAKYGYTWLVQADDQQIDQYKSSSPIQVLKQDEIAHAVYHTEEKILAASVFKANVEVGIKQIRQVSTPMIVMMKEKEGGNYDVAFTKPDMDRSISSVFNNDNVNNIVEAVPGNYSTISIQLNGTFENCDPSNLVSVTSVNGITTISYDSSHDGETYRVSLKNVGTGIHDTEKEAVKVLLHDGELSVNFSELCTHSIELIDINGQVLKKIQADSIATILDVVSFNSGIYFVRVVTDNKEQMFKVFKK